jgi:hypothetical protein
VKVQKLNDTAERINKLLDGPTALATSASSFLRSILKFHETTGSLSENQIKVLESMEERYRYSSGGNYELRSACADKPVLVLANNHKPVVSAAKGSKPYRVLPVGTNKYFEAEERDLKAYKKKKKSRGHG